MAWVESRRWRAGRLAAHQVAVGFRDAEGVKATDNKAPPKGALPNRAVPPSRSAAAPAPASGSGARSGMPMLTGRRARDRRFAMDFRRSALARRPLTRSVAMRIAASDAAGLG